MLIEQSDVRLSAQHSLTHQHKESLDVHVWQRSAAPPRDEADVLLEISDTGLALLPQKVEISAQPGLDELHSFEFSLLKSLVERLTGQEIKLFDPASLKQDSELRVELKTPDTARPAETPDWGLSIDYYESRQETETLSIAMNATVNTSDGQQIAINLTVNMSRQFTQEQSLNIRAGAALKDPLVINFGGTAAELTQRDFTFDIDSDGQAEQIAFLKPDSGFLALDRNADGQINDGTELFGAQTGKGFEELAVYDQDHNQWIDENDSIYERLRIWSRDDQGQERLVALGELGIGAVYLGHIASPFTLADSNNELLGAVRETGLFLREDGTAGSIQQLDLVV